MRKITFHMSDEDWTDAQSMIGDGKKYVSITDFMNAAVRSLIEKRKRVNAQKMKGEVEQNAVEQVRTFSPEDKT